MINREWFGLYQGNWGSDLVPEAYAHPAKVQPQLARKIIAHMIEQGYIQPGQMVADPFGGIAGFALACMEAGLHWRGCELESRFVDLARQNIALWESLYAPHFPGWGTAEIHQGDSRQLATVLGEAACLVTSPPYAENRFDGGKESLKKKQGFSLGYSAEGGYADNTPGQLGAMKEGDVSAIISSPPYAESVNSGKGGIDWEKAGRPDRLKESDKRMNPMSTGEFKYGQTPGQLGAMKEGDVAAIVSSPPFLAKSSTDQDFMDKHHKDIGRDPAGAGAKSLNGNYGSTPGQLGAMKEGSAEKATKKSSQPGYSAIVSSPPFESSMATGTFSDAAIADLRAKGHGPARGSTMGATYGESPANIGNDSGDTFWAASAEILRQCYQILTPGGVAAFVCGDFVRKGKRVYFGRQWLDLCVSVGFEPLEWITAWKQEPGPTQTAMFGEDVDLTIDRVSFFRRLANKNNPDNAILNEDVILVRKPDGEGGDGLARAVVSSPPFVESIGTKDQEFWDNHNDRQRNWNGATRAIQDYGSTPGQLGAMKEGKPPE